MKICIYGNVYDAFLGKPQGGGELQMSMMVREFANKGHKVIVVDTTKKKKPTTIDGIDFLFFERNVFNVYWLYKFLSTIECDIYYSRMRDFFHFFGLLAARKRKAKFILGLAHDLDVASFYKRLKHFYLDRGFYYFITRGILTEILYNYTLKNSDLVIAQHKGQLNCKKLKRRPKILINNLFNQINNANILYFEYKWEFDYIYVGSLDKRKGLKELYKLIKNLLDKNFLVVGNARGKQNIIILNEIAKFTNVKVIGKIEHYKVFENILKSKALISTSLSEGFPNAFLEAWYCGKPVISLNVDPGNVIKLNSLGMVCNGDIKYMIEILRNFDHQKYSSADMKNYVISNHSTNQLQKLIDKLESIL